MPGEHKEVRLLSKRCWHVNVNDGQVRIRRQCPSLPPPPRRGRGFQRGGGVHVVFAVQIIIMIFHTMMLTENVLVFGKEELSTLFTDDFAHANVTLTKLSFGSCHKSKYASPLIWQRIQEQESQAWMWLGDAVYPPMRKIAPAQTLVDEYNALKQSEGYAKLLESTPFVMGTWDDHDFGGNDMGKHMPDIALRRDAFYNFLGTNYNNHQPAASLANVEDDNDNLNSLPPSRRRVGVYHSATFGTPPNQIKLIFLDTRSYRDNHCIPSVATGFPLGAGVACATRWIAAGLLPQFCKQQQGMGTILGEEQWEWLEHELKTSTASINVIASSVQVLSTNPVMEGWCHFPSERKRLLRLFRQTPGALLLSGDVHYAEILNAPGGLVEVTSSGLTHVCTKHIYGPICKPLLQTFHAHRKDKEAFYIGRNFGSLSIDWSARKMKVTIHNATSGAVVLQTDSISIDQTPYFSEEELEQIPTCMDGHLIPLAVAFMAGFLILIALWRIRS